MMKAGENDPFEKFLHDNDVIDWNRAILCFIYIYYNLQYKCLRILNNLQNGWDKIFSQMSCNIRNILS